MKACPILTFAAVLVVGLLGACDPGGSYRVPGGIPQGRAFILSGGAQTSLRTSASWFTASLDVSLEITNRGATPLDVHPDAAGISDREGPMARNESRPAFRCRNHDGAVVTLATGETCEIEMSFRVKSDKDRLSKLTLAQDGVTRGGAPVPIRVIYLLE
jgi:hypothetical protein